MRWERLFDDLESQLAAAEDADLAAEVADRTRRDAARVRLVDRLRAAAGRTTVTCQVQGAGPVSGRVLGAGPDWLLVGEEAGPESLVPVAGLLAVGGLGSRAAVPGEEGRVAARLGLGHVLRGVARDRSAVVLQLTDGSALTGTLDRVGADYVEMAEHAPWEPRRAADVRGVRAVPFVAIAVLRRA